MIKIYSWIDGSVLHKGDFETIKELLEDGVKNGISFNYAKLNDAQLNDAKLNNAELNYAELNNAQLNNAKLNDAQLNNAKLNDAQLNNAKLNNAQLNYAELNNAKLNNAQLNYAELNNAQGKVFYIAYFGHHHCIATATHISIGCERHTVKYWLKNYKEIGLKYGYSKSELTMYGAWIKTVSENLAA